MAPENLLLAAVHADVRERLARHTRTVHLDHAEILHRPGQTIEQVFFRTTA